jgi:phosphomevalonate kinase
MNINNIHKPIQISESTQMENVQCIIIISGKRYAGKDYFGKLCEIQLNKLLYDQYVGHSSDSSATNQKVYVKFVHVTTEIKKDFSKYAQINFFKLETDRFYKEKYRIEMTNYSNIQMEKYGTDYYNKLFIKNILENTKTITIYIVDCRYEFEINLYKSLGVPMILVRVNVNDNIRIKRGWTFDPKIDNYLSEIDLDNYTEWNLVFENNSDGDSKIIKCISYDLYPLLK